MNDAREKGTTLNNLKVLKIGHNKLYDTIEYLYSHEHEDFGPYNAFVPRGTIESLGLKVRRTLSNQDYKDRTENIIGYRQHNSSDKTEESR